MFVCCSEISISVIVKYTQQIGIIMVFCLAWGLLKIFGAWGAEKTAGLWFARANQYPG